MTARTDGKHGMDKDQGTGISGQRTNEMEPGAGPGTTNQAGIQ